MRRRGFLSTLLIPLLPAPQLPMEQEWDGTMGSYTGETKFYVQVGGVMVGHVKNWDVRPIGPLIEAHTLKAPIKGFNVTFEES